MKHVLILGATSGIAKALAYALAERKVCIVLAGRDLDDLNGIARDITLRHDINVGVEYFDALDYQQHESFHRACQKYTLDGLLLAYGYLGDQKKAEKDFTEAQRIIESNFVSAVSILHFFASEFESKKKGCIAVISSVAGDRGRKSNYVYGAAKGALSIYLQGLRNRLSNSGVQVVTIKPGFVDTKMTYGMLKNSPLVGSTADVAKDILYGIERNRDIIYTRWFWKYIMLIIKLVPERLFKRLEL